MILVCFSDGRHEAVSFDKITSRIQKLCYGLSADFVDPVGLIHHSKQKEKCKREDVKSSSLPLV